MIDSFKDFLKAEESLFTNELALDIEYTPPIIKFRENQQKYIADCIKPLFQKRNGKNLLITGQPGIGKTVAVKHLFNELNKETDDIHTIYINCWKHETAYKIVTEICKQLNYKWIQNRRTDELLKEVVKIINKSSVTICFDEIDKIQDINILYLIIEDLFRKTILLITNENNWFLKLDTRIRSRLTPELLEFKPYNLEETKGILKQRVDLALAQNCIEESALNLIIKRTYELKDIRTGLFLLREATLIAENKSLRKIKEEHAEEAIKKIPTFKIKKSSDLEKDEKFILSLIKENSGKKLIDIYKIYKEKNGQRTYRTFLRKIKSMEKSKIIQLEELEGKKSKTFIIKYPKKVTDF